ncbi:hypothetical protein FXO38_08518 [Capsicum annuum]|nr:hypothetical protein FXO38_08518 [Capsicum annuum]
MCRICPPLEDVFEVSNGSQVSDDVENVDQINRSEPVSLPFSKEGPTGRLARRDDYVFETSLGLDGCPLESELVCSKSSPRVDPTLFRYNILFEDDIVTPNEPSGENDVEGITCLEGNNLYANPLWCDNIPSKDENLFLEDKSTLKGKECEVLERDNQLGEDNFDFLESLRNPISDCSLIIDCGCDPLYDTPLMFDDCEHELFAYCEDLSNNPFDFSSGMCLLEGTSIEKKYVHCLEITSSTMYDLIVESTHVDHVETSSKYIHEDTLVKVNLNDTFLHSLFAFDDMHAIVESISCGLDEDYEKRECCLDQCLWQLFPFDPGAILGRGRVNLGLGAFLLDVCQNQVLGAFVNGFLICNTKDSWLYVKYEPS